MKAISLFSGMGGDSLGMVRAGLDLVAYSEKEAKFRETHDLNFVGCESLGATVNGDITKIPDSEFLKHADSVDMIFAGFPCQGFSQAGKKDANDVRNTLFSQFLRATRLVMPKYIIGENVKGLLTRKMNDGQLYIDVIVSEFEKLGYKIKYQICKTDKFGIPQKRERLLIIGSRTGSEPVFPKEVLGTPNLQNIVKFNMTGSIKIEPADFDMSTIPTECILTDMENEEEDNSPHPYLRLKAKTRNESYGDKTHYNLLSFAKRDSPIHCEIIDIRMPSKTIICTYEHQPRLFVPLRNKNGYYLRCLLPDELKQIQGFPADYKIAGNLKQQIVQIGNSVPPGLIKLIAESLIGGEKTV
jgi:DNA (cytosine-5)-methyltransferase 1